MVVHDLGAIFVLRVVELLAVDFESGGFVAARSAVELPECIFIEPEMPRPLVITTELPLARDAGRITGVAEKVARGLLREIEMPETRVIPLVDDTRHKSDTRRRAERLPVCLLETHTSCRETVHHGPLIAPAAICGDALAAGIIDRNEHHVVLSIRGMQRGRG